MNLSTIISFCLGLIVGVILQAYVPAAANGLETAHSRFVAWEDQKAIQRYHQLNQTP